MKRVITVVAVALLVVGIGYKISQDSFFAPETQRDPFDDTPVRSPAAPTAGPKNWAGPSTSKFQPGDFGPPGDAGGDIIGRR